MATPLAMLKSWIAILGFQALGFLAMSATAVIAVVAVPPPIWGQYWLLLSIVQVVSGVGLSWVAQSVSLLARAEMRASGDIRGTLSSALALQAVIAAALLAAAWMAWQLAPPLRDVSSTAFVLMATVVVLMAALETFSYALQSADRFQGLGLGAALGKLGPLLAVAAIWVGMAATSEVLLGGLVVGFATGLAVAIWAMPPRRLGLTRPTLPVVRDILGYGGWLPVASTAGVLSAWMHVWFVGYYGGPGAAGIYGWAASLYALVGAALMPLSAVIAPHLIDLALADEKDRSQHRARLFLAVTLLAAVAAPAVLGLVRLAATALPDRYAGAGPILVVLLSAVPAQLLCYLAGPQLRAYPGLIGRLVAVNVVMAALNLGFNLLLTRHLEGIGAALSMSLSIWFGAALLFLQVRRAIGADPSGAAPNLVLAAAAGVCILAALVADAMPAGLALGAGLVVSVLLLVGARSAGLLRPMSAFTYHLSFLPHAPRRILTGFLEWCDTPRR